MHGIQIPSHRFFGPHLILTVVKNLRRAIFFKPGFVAFVASVAFVALPCFTMFYHALPCFTYLSI